MIRALSWESIFFSSYLGLAGLLLGFVTNESFPEWVHKEVKTGNGSFYLVTQENQAL